MRFIKIIKVPLFLLMALFIIFPIVSVNGQQIEITSDSFFVDDNKTRAVFSGNVIIKQPDLTVWANEVVVLYGEGGPSDLKEFEAIGNVKIKQPEQSASGDRGIYNPKVKILRLFGNVSVTNESGTITGKELIVDIASGTSSFPADGDGSRVTAIFSAQ